MIKIPDDFNENLIEGILKAIGEDPKREGLIGTPDRVVRMWKEIFRGYDETQKPKLALFKNGKDGISYNQMITDTGDFYSHCEHHMVPFFGKYWFAYIPAANGNILGLSKVARIVDFYSAKLQIQERLVHEIIECLWEALSTKFTEPIAMGLIMEGEHLCKSMRGVKKRGKMTTSALKGAFLTDASAKNEFFQLTKNR